MSGLTEFLTSQLKNCKHFLYGKRNGHIESFHNVCNIYYQKGTVMDFGQYIMRKQFAALHWNMNKQNQSGDRTEQWQRELLLQLEV